ELCIGCCRQSTYRSRCKRLFPLLSSVLTSPTGHAAPPCPCPQPHLPIRFYPSRARRSSCWSTCPPPVSAGMRVPCANRPDSSTQHQRYHLLSAADLNSSRNRNFVHMKGERSGVVDPASRAELGKPHYACFTDDTSRS